MDSTLPTPERLLKLKEQRRRGLNTPQPKRTYSSSQLAIQDHSNQIEEISALNAKIHEENKKLLHQINSQSQSLSQGIDFLQNLIASKKMENNELQESIVETKKLMVKMQELLDESANAGIDVTKIPNLEHVVLSLSFEIRPPSKPDEKIDPFVKTICTHNHLFFDCTTNDQFLDKCISFKHEMQQPQSYRAIKVQGKTKDERIKSLKNILYKMQIENTRKQLAIGKELTELQEQLDH